MTGMGMGERDGDGGGDEREGMGDSIGEVMV